MLKPIYWIFELEVQANFFENTKQLGDSESYLSNRSRHLVSWEEKGKSWRKFWKKKNKVYQNISSLKLGDFWNEGNLVKGQ